MADTPARPLTFSKTQRIKQKRDFDRARNQGQRVVQGCLILNWFRLAEGSVSRLGVITSKKVGNAVIRARCRRLLREAYRLNQHRIIGPVDIILVARASMAGRAYSRAETDLVRALRTASLWRTPEI